MNKTWTIYFRIKIRKSDLLGMSIAKLKAILSVSAYWKTPATIRSTFFTIPKQNPYHNFQ